MSYKMKLRKSVVRNIQIGLKYQIDNMSIVKPCSICSSKILSHERILNNIELRKCNGCGFIFANLDDRAVIQKNHDQYTEKASLRFAKRQSYLDFYWFNRIARFFTKRLGTGKVLDVGCGNGVLLKQFIEQGWTVSGADLSDWAKQSSKEYGYRLYSGKFEELDIPENEFDLVTSTNVLEHVPQPFLYLKKIIKLLKPGGMAYFNIPNYGSLSIKLNISKFLRNKPPMHINYFIRKSIEQLFLHPDIAVDIEDISIKSYGIPELHRFLAFIMKIKKFFYREKKSFKKKNSAQTGHTSPFFWYRFLSQIIVIFYYYIGRSFGWGDKMEVIVIKRK